MTKTRRLSLGITILFMGVFVSSEVISQVPAALASDTTETFSFTGTDSTFTVPAGVTSLSVALSGAQGGIAAINAIGTPGRGGFIAVNIPVTTGETFKIVVGGQGQGFTFDPPIGVVPGGWPNGGAGSIGSLDPRGFGTGGGGSTAIYRTTNNVDTLIVVAGGGGGHDFYFGGAGGITGENSLSNPVPFDIISEASGGTGSAGGAGACFDDDIDAPISVVCSESGTSMQGGSAHVSYGGSGGGGGYFGGGAGITKGSGSGGSSWWNNSLATKTSDLSGVRSGNGELSITYSVAASTTTPSTSTSSTAPVGTTPPATIPPVVTTPATTSPPQSIGITGQQKLCSVRRGKSITRTCISTNAKITIPSTSKVVIRVAASSSKICRVSGASVKTLKIGTCSVSLTVTPKKGKAKTYKTKVTVLK
ncbi:unannotated protein [freshwater metagenome]|uniref:receptor protein-tyrosine kinase n=1 Tax=freshwater metagenome TaxID=449393 RepID=A0A6J6KIC3_9ZZZZ|nr:hypothetical protein [Actinomycetota bacterium]